MGELQLDSKKRYETEWNERPCPICGEKDLLELLHCRKLQLKVDDGWFIFEHHDTVCRRCGFVFNGKVSDESFIRNYYLKTTIDIAPNYNSKSRLALIKRFVTPGSKIVEFGSRRGEFSKLLEKNNYHVTEIECNDTIINNNYDCALAYYVLEHVIDPNSFILKMRSSLKDGGIIIVEVPNFHNFTEESFFLEHMNHFTIPHLTTFLTMRDFQILKVDIAHSRYFGFATVAKKGFSKINRNKYSETMARIKDYWKAVNE
jgi:SAM-dependent methyltransferase